MKFESEWRENRGSVGFRIEQLITCLDYSMKETNLRLILNLIKGFLQTKYFVVQIVRFKYLWSLNLFAYISSYETFFLVESNNKSCLFKII